MTHSPARPMALALTWLAVASCSDTGTEPEKAVAPTSAPPALAAASNTWITRANMPSTERTALATVAVTNAAGQSILFGGVIGGKFYVTGTFRELDVYDPATNQWTTRAPMPRPRWLGAGAAVGGKLYVIGGIQRNPDGSEQVVRTMSVYDPATDTWTTKAPMPTARISFAGSRVVLNGQPRIEVVGGSRPGNNLAYIPSPSSNRAW